MEINHQSYKKKRQSFIKEIDSKISVYEHKATGAKIIALINDDDNKVFSASFKTPPEDDYGIAHIIEHSVLCGSKKYPCKEPFVELIKGSLNTFLNAMTFSDKTMYPVASCNAKDFANLVDVYLDAVFSPLISKDAFLQEGWHYTFDQDKLDYKGVVFNEMKGVYSQAESYLNLAKERAFFKGTQYANESGGYPPAITDLTYQHYIDFYKKHYHPSNSYIYLYGDVDLAYYLDYIDKNYLNQYKVPHPSLPQIRQVAHWIKPLESYSTYPLGQEEKEDKKTFLLWSFLLEKCTDPLHLMSFNIINHILLGSSSAPLYSALMESALCENVLDDGFDENNLQTLFSVGVKGSNIEDKTKLEKIIFTTLQNLVENKIDPQTIEAAINRYEFRIREADFGSYPKGLIYNINMMLGWLHDEEPEKFLAYEKTLATLKALANQGQYFEDLISKYLINNPSYLVTICQPDKKFNDKMDNYYSHKLQKEKKQFNQQQLQNIAKETKLLEAKQLAEDSLENLAKMPSLNKNSVDKKMKYSLPQPKTLVNQPIFYTIRHTSNIYYFNLAFNARCLTLEELHYLPLFTSFYLNVGSKNFKAKQLQEQIDLVTGGTRLSCLTQTSDDGNDLQIYGLLTMKIMQDKLHIFNNLLDEIISNIDFSNKDKIFELLKAKRENLLNYLNTSGETIAIKQIEAQLNLKGQIDQQMSDFQLYDLVNSILNDFEKSYNKLLTVFRTIKNKIFVADNLSIGLTCNQEMQKDADKLLTNFIKKLPQKRFVKQLLEFKPQTKKSLAISTQNSIQYVAKGIKLEGFNIPKGYFIFVNQLLRTTYLWDNVRVKGGAYGCFIRHSANEKSYILCSYRDPNLIETLNVYDKISQYLKKLKMSNKDFEKLFIGTVGTLDKPLTAQQQGQRDFFLSLQGTDNNKLQQIRDDLFAFQPQDINIFIKLFDHFSKHGCIVVHGGQQKIKTHNDLFEKIITIGE